MLNMNQKLIKPLSQLRNELNSLIENQIERILNLTDSAELEVQIQKNVIDCISLASDEIDYIIDNISNGEYDKTNEYYDEDDDD